MPLCKFQLGQLEGSEAMCIVQAKYTTRYTLGSYSIRRIGF